VAMPELISLRGRRPVPVAAEVVVSTTGVGVTTGAPVALTGTAGMDADTPLATVVAAAAASATP
jgi:isopentenyl diphosphate isomerase/L-lactate dehydrogenase-like FMN-dependent dehydrogenase